MRYHNTFILALILVTSVKTSIAKDEDCSKGITYWCHDIMNAKKCNAVDFCIQSVWEKHLVEIDSNPVCDDCKEWVEQARDFVSKKVPFDQIIKTLEWSCQLCPNENGRNKCKSIIEENIAEIKKVILSNMDPDAVCSAIHLCNNHELTEAFKNSPARTTKRKDNLLPFTCGQCHHIGDYIEQKITTARNDDLLEGLLSICGQLSSFSDSCSSLVMRHFSDIRPHLINMLSKQKLCHQTCLQHHKYFQTVQETQTTFDDPEIPCELCQQLMLHLRELLITNTTEVEFKNMLKGFCDQMPGLKDECDGIVEQYYHVIYKFLKDGLDADKTCVLMKICKPKKSDTYKVPTMPLITSELFPQPKVDDSSLKLIKNGAMCTACEYTMQLVHMQMMKNQVRDKILDSAKDECKKLPQFRKECVDIIEMFGNQILEAVDIGTNPRIVCPLIKLCPPNFNFHYIEETAVSEKPTCPFCLFAMQEIKEVVSSNSTKDTILNVLNKLCTNLTPKLQTQCKEFVQTYSNQVVDMILADFTPQEACVFIKLCSNSMPKIGAYKIPKIGGESSEESVEFIDFDDNTEQKSKQMVQNPQCELCKSVINILEQRVIDVKSKDEIRRELENSCNRLKKFQKECKAFVDKYSDKIVDLISKELEPTKVCQELMFCVTSDQQDMQDYDVGLDIVAKSFSIQQPQSAEVESSTTCVVCEFVLTKIEDELNDNQNDADIKKIVKNVCSKMPQTISKECNQFIDYYFDLIIALIETTKPSEICESMKLCPKFVDDGLETKLMEIMNDIYSCAVCKGVVDAMDTIIEDPQVDTNLENIEEKICAKFAGKFKDKCHNLASTYGVAIINLLKNIAESDQICYKLNLCPLSGASGMIKLL